MNIYPAHMNNELAAVYNNIGKLICIGSTLMPHSLFWRINLNKLMVILTTYKRRVGSVEYCRLSNNSNGSVWFAI